MMRKERKIRSDNIDRNRSIHPILARFHQNSSHQQSHYHQKHINHLQNHRQNDTKNRFESFQVSDSESSSTHSASIFSITSWWLYDIFMYSVDTHLIFSVHIHRFIGYWWLSGLCGTLIIILSHHFLLNESHFQEPTVCEQITVENVVESNKNYTRS